ncbi:hypothetical protein [Aerobium aerolatum]|uniref:hypothetical protein n=1 Tax=Aerobium aerolatum TaxID=561088 RepID=UPI0015881B9C|nr:hypothetical protein [Aquamicrobium aerolatum]
MMNFIKISPCCAACRVAIAAAAEAALFGDIQAACQLPIENDKLLKTKEIKMKRRAPG